MRRNISKTFSKVCSLKSYRRLLAWVLAFVLVFSPLFAFASTPVDSEVKIGPQWYAFAAYSEVYEVAPPPHLASLAAQVIEEKNWATDTPVRYHLVNYLLSFEQVDLSGSSIGLGRSVPIHKINECCWQPKQSYTLACLMWYDECIKGPITKRLIISGDAQILAISDTSSSWFCRVCADAQLWHGASRRLQIYF